MLKTSLILLLFLVTMVVGFVATTTLQTAMADKPADPGSNAYFKACESGRPHLPALCTGP
jgi:hypothetical protein